MALVEFKAAGKSTIIKLLARKYNSDIGQSTHQ